MTKQPKESQLDWDLFEGIIAYNCTLEEVYLANVIDSLKLKYINNDSIRKYLGIIFDFYRKRNTLPNPTEIKAYLADDDLKAAYREVVLQFKTFDKSYNQEELLKNTERFLKERAVYHAVKETVNEVSNANSVDTGTIFTRFEDACNISLVDDLGFDYFNEVDRHIQDLLTVEQYISTGYRWLDKMLGGGFLKSGRAVYNFVGATNSGKSILLGNLGANICAQGHTVVIISLEMSEMVYAKRISSCLTNIPIFKLKQETDALKNLIIDFNKTHPGSQIIFKEFPPNSITPNHIKAYLRKLQQKRKVKIGAVVLDYLTLLQPTIITGGLYADGKAISEQIRALTYPINFGCPFITAGQLNRSGYGDKQENPGIQSTGESMGIGHTMDFQSAIWSTDADRELGIIHLGLQKSRFGPNFGTHAFRIDYDTLKITESEDVFTNTDNIQSTDNILEKLEMGT